MEDVQHGGASVFVRSPGLDAANIETAVTIPTFRRPEHLLRTIESVHDQIDAATTAIIVIENESVNRAGAEAVGPLFSENEYNGLVIVAHERGNCQAYNAGWSVCLNEFPNLKWVAVLDDDEIASPSWLEGMKQTADECSADICGGPQIPVFLGNPPEKWKSHPVFTPHYCETGPVETLYSSGNLLLRADVLRQMPQPFMDLAFNFTGGGDTDFLRRAKANGKRLAWCNEAPVNETIPETRVTRDWIIKRSLRNGELSARIEHRARAKQSFGRLITIARSIALAGAAIPRSGVAYLKHGSFLNGFYHLYVALGRLLSEFGYVNEQYRNPTD
ncbi:MAG: glycosyltransferase [Pseudomonadota bacterium]